MSLGRFFVAVIVGHLCVLIQRGDSALRLEDRGYVGFTVEIQPDVPEDVELINGLKSMLVEGSSFLYNATRYGVYLRNITIIIPETWQTNNYDDVIEIGEAEHADVTVEIVCANFTDFSYVKQHGRCGESGKSIHFNYEDIINKKGGQESVDPGRLFVHQFAKYRYGVFEEAGFEGNKLYPKFYIDSDSQTRPSICSKNIQGACNGAKACDYCSVGGLANDCSFHPYREQTNAKSSIMGAWFSKSISSFCERNSSDHLHLHNVEAPSKQNILCNYRGSWDVIKQHSDISNSSNDAGDVRSISPHFRMAYRQKAPRVVFVIDISGSMLRRNRIFTMGQCLNNMFRNELPQGAEVALIVFSGPVVTRVNLTIIETNDDREKLVKNLPSRNDVGGTTSIGLALGEAVQVLQDNGRSLEKSRVVLITDGRELLTGERRGVFKQLSNPVFVDDLVRSDIVFDTIGFGKTAEEKMEDLSKRSGGRFFFHSENSYETTNVLSTIFSELSRRLGNDEITIKHEVIELDDNQKVYNGSVLIDEHLGEMPRFIFYFSQRSVYNVWLQSPNLEKYDANSSNFWYDSKFNTAQFHFDQVVPGEWTYFIERGHEVDPTRRDVLTIDVKSAVIKTSHDAVSCSSWLSAVNITFPSEVPIYAECTRGRAPVRALQVTARVDRPKGDPIEVLLRDDGLGADTTANDGIYSAIFVQHSGNGRYTVNIEASNGGHAHVATQGRLYSDAIEVHRGSKPQIYKRLRPFTRNTLAGSFTLHSFVHDPHVLPPGTIRDLAVLMVETDDIQPNVTRVTVSLKWTAPGEDFFTGTVKGYDIRTGRTVESLLDHYQASLKLEPSVEMNESFVPVSATMVQEATCSFLMTDLEPVLFFAVKGVDGNGTIGNISNVFGVRTKLPKPELATSVTHTHINGISSNRLIENGDKKNNNNNSVAETDNTLIIAITVGVSLLFLLLLILLIATLYKKKSRKVGSYEPPTTQENAETTNDCDQKMWLNPSWNAVYV